MTACAATKPLSECLHESHADGPSLLSSLELNAVQTLSLFGLLAPVYTK